ncbi:type II secretion system minor pseudopilin GspK [Colwellia asteriadis]|uniref:Type II secretion system protein K n=1 Tax=Colwellia asteriadis TaxID=517723 RepID=A0ABP3WCT8_9GAMM
MNKLAPSKTIKATAKSAYSQQGVALITVMLIVALAAIIASQMTTRLQMQMQRSVNASFNQQAYWYAMGAEEFAKRILIASFKGDESVTNLKQPWAAGATSYPVAFGNIAGEITDLQSCLNLNALRKQQSVDSASPAAKTPNDKLPARIALEKLLVALAIDGVSSYEAEAMADSLSDWLDDDGFISDYGAEDDDYASREFSYLAANNYLASVNELRLIEHFTVPAILALKPYVCVLPQSSTHKININTLDVEKAELLQALLGSTLDEAQQILSARDEKGFEKIEDLYSLPEFSKIALEDWQKSQFTIDSEYFSLKGHADFSDSFFYLTSIMQVKSDQKIQIISRTIGRN